MDCILTEHFYDVISYDLTLAHPDLIIEIENVTTKYHTGRWQAVAEACDRQVVKPAGMVAAQME